jgi:hypothetical protein
VPPARLKNLRLISTKTVGSQTASTLLARFALKIKAKYGGLRTLSGGLSPISRIRLKLKSKLKLGPKKIGELGTLSQPNAEPPNFKRHLLGYLKKIKSKSNVFIQPVQTYLNVQANLTT